MQEWLSINQVAEMMGLSTKHIRRLIKRGEIRCANVGSDIRPTLRIAKRDVTVWMEGRLIKASPARSKRDEVADLYFGK